MTLLLDVTIARIVAWFTAFVALTTGLVLHAFGRSQSLLFCFLWTFRFGTWLAFCGVDLHLLQTVVVISLSRNVPLDLRVSPALEETTLLLHLSFVDAFVDLHCKIVHPFRRRRSISTSDLVFDLILQSSTELCRDGFVVPAGLDYQSLELGLVLRHWSALLNGLECAFRLHLFVAVSKRGMRFIKECSWSSHDDFGRPL